jgi:aspartyl-tRNA(Asn)/glutamyl-tRNA(Gln) amidotransferase subunit A
LRRGHSTVARHLESVLAGIHELDPALGAFVAVAGDEALRQAEAADRMISALGERAWTTRPLLGVTFSVKDLIQTRDLPTRRGSLLPNHRAAVDAPAVMRLREAGAIIVGKTTTSEYGWSASTVSRVAGPTRNPWNHERSAGGSSGGAAAAVSAGLCTAALGTDGAGSIRIPAAFCGVVGFKPTYARIPYVPPCADRLAHVGPVARSVADVAELTSVLAGRHNGDPDSMTGSVRSPRRQGPLRIGWIEFPRTSPEVRRVSEQSLSVLKKQGHQVECIAVPFSDPYDALVDIIAASEAAATAPADHDQCDQGRIAVVAYGRTLSGASVMRAEQARLDLRVKLASVMDHYDLLAMATVPVEPFSASAIGPPWAADPAERLWLAWAPATYPFNLTGQPALSMPAGFTDSGLPVGLQLVGPVGGDDLVLWAASRVEADLRLALVPPPVVPQKG